MLKRIIPILLLKNNELVKSIKFKNHKYIGDIINSVKIFNELEVDELLILDISASSRSNDINYNLLSEIASECFMPVTYGGNVDSIKKIEKILKLGIEKVNINSNSTNYNFLSKAVKKFGTSTISIGIDYLGDNVYISNGREKTNLNVISHILELSKLNVGEIIIQNIENDGTCNGYDLKLLKKITNIISNPIVIAGGCRDLKSIFNGFSNGANACAAGSLFVYYTKAKGILINYPDEDEFINNNIKR